jgi:predicted Zn-dependent peptidase
MTHLLRTLWIVVIAATGALAQVPDRSAPPKPGPLPPVKLPPIQKRQLANGLPVWIVEQHEVPVAQVDLVVRTGSAADPTGKEGLASLTAAMLDEGAGSRDALALADAIDFLGAEISTGSGFDSTSVGLHVPVARLADALPLMADVALGPTFPAKELDRLRTERLTAVQQARDEPETIVVAAFNRVVFGAHRYGTSMLGSTAGLKGFTVEDLRSFHSRFTPANAALIVVGDVKPDAVLPLLETGFGGWKGSSGALSARGALSTPAQVKTRSVVIVDKPEAAQSQIRIGWVGVPRSTPDYFAIQVMNTILGGAFTSRLNQNLREKHGYAYGAASRFEMRRAPGAFYAAAGVQTDKTAEALVEFFKELEGITQAVPADELAKAKNYIALRFPQRFETTGDIASQLAEAFIYDLPGDYFESFVDRIQAVTAADVQRVAKTLVQPTRLAVVVVGDRKVIEAPVRALKLGPVSFMKVEEAIP